MSIDASSQRSRGHTAARIVGLAISTAAIWLVARSVDLLSVARQLAAADLLVLVPILAVICVQVTLRALRWRVLLTSMAAGRPVRTRALIAPLLIGYLGNTVLPARLGEPIRAYLAARREALPAADTFGTVLLERVLDTATLGVVAFVAAVATGAPAWLVEVSGVAALLGGGVGIILVLGGAHLLARLLTALIRALPHGLLPLAEFGAGILAGADGRDRRRAIVLAAGISAVCWLGDLTTFWLVARSLGVTLTPGTALLIAAVTVLGTALPSAPGYLGTFELAAATTATLLGVSATPAVAIAVLAHAMTVLPVAIAGATVAAFSGSNVGSLSRAAKASRTAALAEAGPVLPPLTAEHE